MFIDTEVFRRQVRGLRQIALDLRDRALTATTAAGVGRLQLRARIEHR